MSDYQPTKPYVYQPDPVNSPNYPRIYALSGPGVPKEHHGKRYTKDEAQKMLAALEANPGAKIVLGYDNAEGGNV